MYQNRKKNSNIVPLLDLEDLYAFALILFWPFYSILEIHEISRLFSRIVFIKLLEVCFHYGIVYLKDWEETVNQSHIIDNQIYNISCYENNGANNETLVLNIYRVVNRWKILEHKNLTAS